MADNWLSRRGLGGSDPQASAYGGVPLWARARPVWSEGRNVTVEYCWADDQDNRLAALAADLVGSVPVTLIVTNPEGARAAKAADRDDPDRLRDRR